MSTATWEKLPPLDGRANPCLCCPPILAVAPMERVIAVGFGDAHVSRDGEEVYREPSMLDGTNPCGRCVGMGYMDRAYKVICGVCGGTGHVEDPNADEPTYWTVQDAENAALADPEHDWRITLFSPLHGETYQRQGDGQWMLVEKNEGFA